MKAKTTIRSQFGLTQSEMARLLGVGTSLYSMYELGLRDLPLHAKELLAEIFSNTQSGRNDGNKSITTSSESELQHLESLMRENEFQRLVIERKIASLETKAESAQRLSELFDFMASHSNKIGRTAAIDTLALKAGKNSNANYGDQLMKLRIRQELLESERTFLESKMSKATSR